MRLSDAEWKVMTAVWTSHPAAVRDVLEALPADTGWAYSTVKTMLARLVDKGALAMSKRGNTSLFEPLISRQEARRSAVRSLAEKAFGGAFGSLVHHLLDEEKLSGRERAELREMLREAEEAVTDSDVEPR